MPGPDIIAANRDERLGEAVEAYLELAESGTPPDPEVFASGWPDVRDDLLDALHGLSVVRGLVGDPGKPNRLETGRRVAGYRIVRELGRGGMGVVYEAVHVDLDRPVALKVLDARATPDSSSRRRFEDEAKLAAGLHHTHIVPVFDVGRVGGLSYYAMQKIDGSGLDRVLRSLRKDRTTGAGSTSRRSGSGEPPPLTVDLTHHTGLLSAGGTRPALGGPREHPDEAPPYSPPRGSGYYRWVAEVGRQAASALAHAHSRNVVHRDVKPSNVLVDSRGTIWVTDFGLARRLENVDLTKTDGLLGTPRYMSPEQTKAGPTDGRTDVFSLGATLYELLALRPAFSGTSAAELVRQINETDPIPLRRIDPRVPRDLETIVEKALAKRPDDRYPSAAELADDLNRFLKLEPVRARRIGTLGRAWRFTRRHPAPTLTAAAAAIVIVAVTAFSYHRVLRERDAAVAEKGQKEKAVEKLEAANVTIREAMRHQLLSEASLTRVSPVANRRERGLALLEKAAALGPDADEQAKLRNEAVRLLTLRDIRARPSLPTGRASGLVIAPEGNRLTVLSQDRRKVRVWDVAKGELVRGDIPAGPPEHDRRLGRPDSSPHIATAGAWTLVIWPDGHGLRVLDACTGELVDDTEFEGRELIGLYAAESAAGLRFVTIEREDSVDEAPGFYPQRLMVNLWAPGRKEPLQTLEEWRAEDGPRGWPLVAFSPDGETVAVSWVFDTAVHLWGTRTGQAVSTIETPASSLTALALGPEGILAAAGGGAVRLYEIATKTPLPIITPQTSVVWRMRFSPDGALLALNGRANDIEVWDPAAGTLAAALPTDERINDMTFSPPGQRLVAATSSPGDPPGSREGSGKVDVWAIIEPTIRLRASGLTGVPSAVAFAPDGTLAAAVRGTEPPRFWKPAASSTATRTRTDLTGAAFLAFDRDGAMTVFGKTLRIYPSSTVLEPARTIVPLKPRTPAEPAGAPPRFVLPPVVARSADGRALVVGNFDDLQLWRADRPDDFVSITPPASAAADRPFPRGPRGGGGPRGGAGSTPPTFWRGLALGNGGRRLYLWSFRPGGGPTGISLQAWAIDPETGRAERLPWVASGLDVSALALSPDGATLAVGDRSGAVVLLDTARGAEVGRVPAETAGDDVRVLAFGPAGRELAIGTLSGDVRLASLTRRPSGSKGVTPAVHLPGHRNAVSALAYDADGRRLATAGEDKEAYIWELSALQRELERVGLGWTR